MIKNKSTTFIIFNIILLSVLLALSFPLYKLISSIAGYKDRIQLNDNDYVKNSIIITPKTTEIIERRINIKFNASVDDSLNWKFESLENLIEINVGENTAVDFKATNLSNKTITATADFVVSPEKILPYLIKTECFCFIEQTLAPGESQTFSMVFYIDPSLDADDELNDLKNLRMTYKFTEYKT